MAVHEKERNRLSPYNSALVLDLTEFEGAPSVTGSFVARNAITIGADVLGGGSIRGGGNDDTISVSGVVETIHGGAANVKIQVNGYSANTDWSDGVALAPDLAVRPCPGGQRGPACARQLQRAR